MVEFLLFSKNVNTPVCTDFCQPVILVARSTVKEFTFRQDAPLLGLMSHLVWCHPQSSIKHFLNRQLEARVPSKGCCTWASKTILKLLLDKDLFLKNFHGILSTMTLWPMWSFYNYLTSTSECFSLNQKLTDDNGTKMKTKDPLQQNTTCNIWHS